MSKPHPSSAAIQQAAEAFVTHCLKKSSGMTTTAGAPSSSLASTYEFLPVVGWPTTTPLPPSRADRSNTPSLRRPSRIAILDASFNPPTLAHAGLLDQTLRLFRPSATPNSPSNKPRVRTLQDWVAANIVPQSSSGRSTGTEEDEKTTTTGSLHPSIYSEHPQSIDHYSEREEGAFDAALLLLSSVNADKKLVGANLAQRLEMMNLIRSEITAVPFACNHPPPLTIDRIGVGLTNGARFVDKIRALRAYFTQSTSSANQQHRSGNGNGSSSSNSSSSSSSGDRRDHLSQDNPEPLPQFYFIMGMDTLERFFDPKYYPGSPVPTDSPLPTSSHQASAPRNYANDAYYAHMNAFFFGESNSPTPSGNESGPRPINYANDDPFFKAEEGAGKGGGGGGRLIVAPRCPPPNPIPPTDREPALPSRTTGAELQGEEADHGDDDEEDGEKEKEARRMTQLANDQLRALVHRFPTSRPYWLYVYLLPVLSDPAERHLMTISSTQARRYFQREGEKAGPIVYHDDDNDTINLDSPPPPPPSDPIQRLVAQPIDQFIRDHHLYQSQPTLRLCPLRRK
ncbi:hypothetical protein H4R33_004658 [Dimargaris cristalligena]|nr:hypothetical protein H4R33_004658 [Dimargaris cristalligena]